MKSIILQYDANMRMTVYGPYHNKAIAEKARMKYIGRHKDCHFTIFPLTTGLMVTSPHNLGYAEHLTKIDPLQHQILDVSLDKYLDKHCKE